MAGHEIELKFSLSAEAGEALGAGLFAGVEADELVSTYFDTPDRALLNAEMALRLRSAGKGWVQTLKAGSNAVRRLEDEHPVAGARLDPSRFSRGKFGKAVGSRVGDLQPVFETRVRRRTRLLEHGGAVIEAALDEGEIVAGDRREPLHEFELELKSGGIGDLLQVAGPYVEAGAMVSLVTKAQRGYRLAAGDSLSAVGFQTPALDFSGSARKGFQALALAALHQVSANIELLRRRASPEAVHQARVGLRRLDTFVGAFQALVRDEHRGAVDSAIARLTAVFEDARALDVFQSGAFRTHARHEPGAADFGRALLAARSRAYTDLGAALGGREVAEDMFRLIAWVVAGPWTLAAHGAAADRPLAHLARRMLRHRWSRLKRRGERLNWSDPRARHKLRIQAKKMRYLSETLLDPGAARAMLRRLKVLQSELGALNDIATASRTVDLATTSGMDPQAAFAAGTVLGAYRSGLPRRLKAARKAFRRLQRRPAAWSDFRRTGPTPG